MRKLIWVICILIAVFALILGSDKFFGIHEPARANCMSSLRDQMKYIHGVFDVEIEQTEHLYDQQLCKYTLRVNEVIKSEKPVSLTKLILTKRLGQHSCVEAEVIPDTCELPENHYLLFTAGGNDYALDGVIEFNNRYSYFQPLEKSEDIKNHMKHSAN